MAEKEIRRQLKLLLAMSTINHSFGAHLELEDVSRIAVRELVKLLNCDGCAVLLFDGDKIRVPAEKDFLKFLNGVELSTNTPAIRHLINTRRSIFSQNFYSPPVKIMPNRALPKAPIFAPVIIREEVRGLIYLHKDSFNRDDIHFAESLAHEVAIALERAMVYSQVKILGIRDGLTGTFNRRKFDEDLEAEIARSVRYNSPLSLVMVDIDYFKAYNDVHGHPMGDNLLKRLVTVLSANLRPFDKVYRYGGEEFAVLLPETGKEKALLATQRLMDVIRQESFEGEKESQPTGKLTVSMGLAGFPEDGNTKDLLIKHADKALYQAKSDGRDRIWVHKA